MSQLYNDDVSTFLAIHTQCAVPYPARMVGRVAWRDFEAVSTAPKPAASSLAPPWRVKMASSRSVDSVQ